MPVATVGTSPTLIQVGPGLLWANCAKPADGATLLVSGGAAANDPRVYGPLLGAGSGTFMGSTIGESSIAYRPTFVDVKIESSTATVEKVLDQEEARVNFSLAELTASGVQLSLPGKPGSGPVATISSAADPFNSVPSPGSGAQTMDKVTVGGLRLVAPMCVVFVSPNRRIGISEGPFSYVFTGYAAVSTEGFEAPFSRGGVTTWRASYELISDTSRSIGDQLFQFVVRR